MEQIKHDQIPVAANLTPAEIEQATKVFPAFVPFEEIMNLRRRFISPQRPIYEIVPVLC